MDFVGGRRKKKPLQMISEIKNAAVDQFLRRGQGEETGPAEEEAPST